MLIFSLQELLATNDMFNRGHGTRKDSSNSLQNGLSHATSHSTRLKSLNLL